MSYSITLVGRDKAKLKAAVRNEQCKDEQNNPHSGVPSWVCDRLCMEIDRCRTYEFSGKTYGLKVDAAGSWHDGGASHQYSIGSAQMVE